MPLKSRFGRAFRRVMGTTRSKGTDLSDAQAQADEPEMPKESACQDSMPVQLRQKPQRAVHRVQDGPPAASIWQQCAVYSPSVRSELDRRCQMHLRMLLLGLCAVSHRQLARHVAPCAAHRNSCCRLLQCSASHFSLFAFVLR